MLVLSRRVKEKLVLPDLGVTIQVVAIKSGTVRLGIEAPPDVSVLREEVHQRDAEWQPAEVIPAHPGPEESRYLQQLLRNRLKITRAGLAMLRRQMQAGLDQEAEETLTRIEEDLQMLRERLDDEAPKPVAPPVAAGRACKALLVEDNDNERELLATYLRTSGLDVATAPDGTDALEYLHSRGRPDVILLDMGMPRCDGPTTLRKIRDDPAYAGLKIFAVSGHSPEEYDLAVGPAGIDHWFHKPINPADLVTYLQQEINGTLCR
jgi:carbon storage regulator CsrA